MSMDIDQLIKILGIAVSLIQVLIWPLIALFALILLGNPIKGYINKLSKDGTGNDVSIEVGGFKFSVKRTERFETNSEIANKKALEDASTQGMPLTQTNLPKYGNKELSQIILKVAGARLLWVDDNPLNNIYARKALEDIGIQITESISTEDALDKIAFNRFDVIISDMGRQPTKPGAPYEKQAGYTLLAELHKQGNTTPFIIFAGSNSQEHQEETLRRGGFGTTNNVSELIQLVIQAIG